MVFVLIRLYMCWGISIIGLTISYSFDLHCLFKFLIQVYSKFIKNLETKLRELSFLKIFYFVPLQMLSFYSFSSFILDFFKLGSSILTRDHNSMENILSSYNIFLYSPVSPYYKTIVSKFTSLVGYIAHIFSKQNLISSLYGFAIFC